MKTKNFKINNTFVVIKNLTTWLFLIGSLGLVAYLSFIDNINFDLSIQSAAIFSIVASVISIMIWNMFYSNYFDKIIYNDINKGKYGIHMKYYYSRQGFTEDILRTRIERFNKDAKESWLKDVVSQTGRDINKIKKGRYKGNSHKFLIFRVKHNLFPQTGIKYPKQLLNILSVGASDSYNYKLYSYKTVYISRLIRKIVLTILAMYFTYMISVDFITGNYLTAFVQLGITVLTLLVSIFGGIITGIKAASLKLATGEEISRLLNSWKLENDIKSQLIKEVDEKDYDDFVNKNIPDVDVEKPTERKPGIFNIDVD